MNIVSDEDGGFNGDSEPEMADSDSALTNDHVVFEISIICNQIENALLLFLVISFCFICRHYLCRRDKRQRGQTILSSIRMYYVSGAKTKQTDAYGRC